VDVVRSWEWIRDCGLRGVADCGLRGSGEVGSICVLGDVDISQEA